MAKCTTFNNYTRDKCILISVLKALNWHLHSVCKVRQIYTAHNISFWPGVIITDSRIIRLSFTLWQDRKDSCWLPCLLSTSRTSLIINNIIRAECSWWWQADWCFCSEINWFAAQVGTAGERMPLYASLPVKHYCECWHREYFAYFNASLNSTFGHQRVTKQVTVLALILVDGVDSEPQGAAAASVLESISIKLIKINWCRCRCRRCQQAALAVQTASGKQTTTIS